MASCQAPATTPGAATPAPALEPASFLPAVDALQTGRGQLQVFTNGFVTDGRRIRVRGAIRNPYPEPVDGVRLVFLLLSRAGADAEVLETMQRVLDERVESGHTLSLHWDAESSYAGATGASFLLEAFAATRAGAPVAPPPGWRP